VDLPFTFFKKYLTAKKEELWKLKYFTIYKKKKNLPKNPLKETKILQDTVTLELINLNLEFQHKPKYHVPKKNSSYKNRPIIIIT
jgi:hypothetical protein